jgi:hypothetical protein
MPTMPRRTPVSQQPDAAERRLHIHGIREMPAGYDAEVAELFRDLRAATSLSEMDLAARMGTRPEVVQALEQGALFALPPWAETCRVVNAYGAMLNLDVRPLLRRIYAQLEAGIVELQPKTIPDVPVMAPSDNNDFNFATGNAGGNASGAPNPLDIPWPPPQQQQPNRTARPNAQGMPVSQAPQAPRPNAQPSSPQQAPWPNAAPKPQAGWPAQQPHQQHPSQASPGNQPMTQAPRPQAPPQRQAAPQPLQGDRRQAQPRPQQGQAPHSQPQPEAQARRQAPQPPRPAPPELEPKTAGFGPAPAPAVPEPEPKRGRSKLLKWGLGALIVSVVAFGLWLALSQAPHTPGLQAPSSGTLDPDDPRSRKSDRLPNAF